MERWNGAIVKDKSAEPPAPPTVCPYCRSTRIAAPIGTTGPATYWRCDGCGEMWDAGRQAQKPMPGRWDRY